MREVYNPVLKSKKLKQSGLRVGLIVATATLLSIIATTASSSAMKIKQNNNVTVRTQAFKPVQTGTAGYVGGPANFVDFNQNATSSGKTGTPWGSRIAGSGCGPTSAAMVVATLTGRSDINPARMADILTPTYYIPGSGTTTGAFPYIGQRWEKINVGHGNWGDAKSALRQGGLVIVHANPNISKHFTSAGHYMVLRYVGKDDRFTIADPNGLPGRDSEKKTWTADQLNAAGIDDIWTFTLKS